MKHPPQLIDFLTSVHPETLWKLAESKLLFLVPKFVKETPALQGLKNNGKLIGKIKSATDFTTEFPVLDKENYVKKNTLLTICRGGKLPRSGSFYKSAGTSGKPTFWAESVEEELAFDRAVAFMARLMLDMASHDYTIINSWALGSWPTGINFASSVRFQGRVVNVGTNLEEALDVLQRLDVGGRYLVAGYPPFIYHLFEEGGKTGIFDPGFSFFDVVTGGEGFVEEWRDEIIKKIGMGRTLFPYMDQPIRAWEKVLKPICRI